MPSNFFPFQDQMSDCRSFGSNFHPSSQSRKISIGVMVDYLAKRKPGRTKEDQDKRANAERIKPSIGISLEGKNKGDAVTTSEGKQTEYAGQVKSPWITPRSLHRKALAPETASLREKTSNPRQKKLNTAEDVPETYSAPCSPNQNFNAHNIGSKQNKFDGLINGFAYQRKGRKDGNSQRVEELNFANASKDKVELKHKAGNTQNIQTETLKQKLQELFGTVSSPKSLQSSLQSHKVIANNSKQERSADHVVDTAVKPRQNSVTVEIVSDNPNKTVKRPVTCPLIQKRSPAKVQLANTKIGLSFKQKHGDSIFSFGEGRSAKLDGTVNGGSLLPRKRKTAKKSSKIDPHQVCFPEENTADEIKQTTYRTETPPPAKLSGTVNGGSLLPQKKGTEKKSSKIDPHQFCFPEENNADEIKQTTYRSETPLPAEKTSILGNKIESLPDSFSEKGSENFEKVQEKDTFHPLLTNERNQQSNFDNPPSPEKGDKQEDEGNTSLRNFVQTQDDFRSPTFGFKTPILNTSVSPTPKTVEIEQGTCSPVPFERGLTLGNFGSFRTFQTSGPFSTKSNAESQSPEDTGKHTNSSLREPMPGKETIDAVNEHSESSSASEQQWSGNFEEGSPIIKNYDLLCISIDSSYFFFFSDFEILLLNGYSFDSLSDDVVKSFLSKVVLLYLSSEGAGIGETYWFQEHLEQEQEDELTRAITLLALALETFKRKIDSATTKKSTEILMSISEEMKSMLLNAEAQIESDVGKLTSLSKTKRKRLETRLQEQQELLKLILEKFKEDIHRHLLDCSSILEGMEAYQNELKGTMKKQSMATFNYFE
ncbi:Ankyrin and armadillo repeat-containing [Gossypium australe]|uniref:Ankyrin and armadillo repeat-containing n=1 Tax=Gossypium australe TaxID=47621 RepID=A0A5B6W1Z9_9ROSI|nr:Ankyrin and armadillo repeat-containing [Gossypium australe]